MLFLRFKMYKNIESGTLKLPFYLSSEVSDLIMKLLNRDPQKRIGAGKEDTNEIKVHPWFKSIDWDLAKEKRLPVPKPRERKLPKGNISIDIFGNQSKDQNNVKGWEFASKINI